MFAQKKEIVDAAEHFILSPLALLKMLKHARSGIPLEVMGLMLGEYVNSYTIKIVDVFAMPQTGTNTTVESIDPVYQTDMIECLEKTGRKEYNIGWYHSHPGFGCWLSQTDCSTQQEFEKLNERCLAVVVDPVQSVKGNVVLEAFRTIPGAMSGMGADTNYKQVCGNEAYLNKPSFAAIIHGLNRNYYTIRGEYKLDKLELNMLLNLEKKIWTDYLKIPNYNFNLIENQLIKHIEDNNKTDDDKSNDKFEINYKKRLEKFSKDIVNKSTLHKLLVNIHKEILNI